MHQNISAYGGWTVRAPCAERHMGGDTTSGHHRWVRLREQNPGLLRSHRLAADRQGTGLMIIL